MKIKSINTEIFYKSIKSLGKLLIILRVFKSVESYVYTVDNYNIYSLFVKYNCQNLIYRYNRINPYEASINMIRHGKLRLTFKM